MIPRVTDEQFAFQFVHRVDAVRLVAHFSSASFRLASTSALHHTEWTQVRDGFHKV